MKSQIIDIIMHVLPYFAGAYFIHSTCKGICAFVMCIRYILYICQVICLFSHDFTYIIYKFLKIEIATAKSKPSLEFSVSIIDTKISYQLNNNNELLSVTSFFLYVVHRFARKCSIYILRLVQF